MSEQVGPLQRGRLDCARRGRTAVPRRVGEGRPARLRPFIAHAGGGPQSRAVSEQAGPARLRPFIAHAGGGPQSRAVSEQAGPARLRPFIAHAGGGPRSRTASEKAGPARPRPFIAHAVGRTTVPHRVGAGRGGAAAALHCPRGRADHSPAPCRSRPGRRGCGPSLPTRSGAPQPSHRGGFAACLPRGADAPQSRTVSEQAGPAQLWPFIAHAVGRTSVLAPRRFRRLFAPWSRRTTVPRHVGAGRASAAAALHCPRGRAHHSPAPRWRGPAGAAWAP